MKQGYNFFERKRRLLTGIVLLPGIILVLLTGHSWRPGGALDLAFDILGIALIVLGLLGRMWATVYIGGRKNQELITTGPYSMCRNPLYLFSFLAGLGLCVELENLLFLLMYVLIFAFYYPFVIKSEEMRLHALFGDAFLEYRKRTPAFLPNPFRLDLGDAPALRMNYVWRTLRDGSIFLIFIPLSFLIEWLHESGVLRPFWSIP